MKTLEQRLLRLGELMRVILEAEHEAALIGESLDNQFKLPEGWGSQNSPDWLDYWSDCRNDVDPFDPKAAAKAKTDWEKDVAKLVARKWHRKIVSRRG